MARINIEDKLFSDFRWMNLVLKVGCRHKAIGILAGAWILAQKNWLKNGFIPQKAWDKDFEVLIEVDLATRRADGNVYIKGSKRAFVWLDQRVEAGRKGGQAKTDKKAKAARTNSKKPRSQATDSLDPNSNIETNEAKRSLSETQAEPSVAKPLTLTPSLSLIPSLPLSSFSTSDSDSNTFPKTDDANAKELRRQIWEAYKSSYFLRYRVEPVRNASVNAKISQIAKRLGTEAIEVVKFFLTHNKSFYVGKLHDIGLCLSDAEALRTQWMRGKAITENDLQKFSKNQKDQEIQTAINEGRV
jgi:hypothetical protein